MATSFKKHVLMSLFCNGNVNDDDGQYDDNQYDDDGDDDYDDTDNDDDDDDDNVRLSAKPTRG